MEKSTEWDASKMPSMEKKTVIVTGANSGIGFHTALELARKGAHVVLACRDEEKATRAVQDIERELSAPSGSSPPNEQQTSDVKAPHAMPSVEFMQLDLSDMTSVRAFAKKFQQSHHRLDLLINNAGIYQPPHALTEDGFESQFATNHLGHFLLTTLLFDLIKKSSPSRIVNVSSVAHRRAQLDVTKLTPTAQEYSPDGMYRTTKLCNLLFTYELDRRLRKNQVDGVLVVASHPGLSYTSLFANSSGMVNQSWFRSLSLRLLHMLPVFQPSQVGALPTMFAASMPNVKSGEYYGPNGWLNLWGKPALERSNELSHSEELAAKLWETSEQMLGIRFDPK